MLRLASVLLVCVLLSTSAISGTFAKYSTTASASDSARIAKWGIGKPDSLEFALFAADAFDADKVLSANGTDKVLAPGTAHEQTVKLFTISGTAPEVMYNYSVALTAAPEALKTIEKLDSLEGFKWTLKAPGATAATDYATFAALKKAVDGLSQTKIEPNHLPTGYATGENTMAIGWVWDFGDDANNVADTAAGDEAAAGSLDTFTLTLDIKAEQVD